MDPSEELGSNEDVITAFDLIFLDRNGNIIISLANVFIKTKAADIGKLNSFERKISGDLSSYNQVRMDLQSFVHDPSRVSSPPLAIAQSQKEPIKVMQGTYCWKTCVDFDNAIGLIKHSGIAPAEVKPGEKIQISFDFDPQPRIITVMEYFNDLSKPVELKGSQFTVPSEKGLHVYEISSFWFSEESSYAFALYVK